jgi:hypothetical protein
VLRNVALIRVTLAATAAWFILACGDSARPGPVSTEPTTLPSLETPDVGVLEGSVTYEAYERAVLATVQCIREAGMGVSGVTPVPGRRLTYIAYGLPGEKDPRPGLRISSECYDSHLRAIDMAWIIATQPSEQQLDRARGALAECLRAAGESVPDPPSTEDLVRLQQSAPAFGECSDAVSKEFDIAFFGG